MSFLHKNLASGRWFKMSLAEQMGNIGSEVNRALRWRKTGDKNNEEGAVLRALELIDLTISDKRWQGRLLEICRLREVFCDLFFSRNTYKTSSKSLENYFLFFGLIATKK